MPRIITFGEVMARLVPPGFHRFRQSLPGPLEVTFGGAESNVAASLANLGADAAFVTALPQHSIADACVGGLRNVGVDTQYIVRTSLGRLGLYFLEMGANQRPSQIIYDRDHSSVGLTPETAYDWKKIFSGADWFHVTGITPAISSISAATTLAAVTAAKQANVTVSCDLNFRKKLWRWNPELEPGELAEATMRTIMPHVDVVIANEEDCADVLSIRAGATDVHKGQLEIDRYPEVAQEVVRQFPNVTQVAITLRESISASHNNWGAMLYAADKGETAFAPLRDGEYQPYEIRNIVDRVGGGDSFGAGLVFALNTPELSAPSLAISFATAASCLAHSMMGDINYATRDEVEKLMRGSGSGRVER